MDYETLNRRHPCCDPETFSRYSALYRGGLAIQALFPKLLRRNLLESGEVYKLRLEEAYYRSYVGPVADFFAAQLFSSSFVIRAQKDGKAEAPDEFYSELREDADGLGTDLAVFLKERFLSALQKRSGYWLAVMPDDDGSPAESRTDWEDRNLGRARLQAVEADDVLDWECDANGRRLWVILHKTEARRDDPRQGGREQITETWWLYDGTDVETFQVVYPKNRRPKAKDPVPSIGRKAHGFKRIPLVELQLPEGLWLLNRVAGAQVEHFRLSNALSWAVRRTCYPMLTFKSDGNAPAPETRAGAILTHGLEEGYEWVSPPATSFEVLANQIEAHRTEIYRIAQQMAHALDTSAAALDRSGDSKAADMAATEICLHAYADHVLEALEDTLELVSDGRGDVETKFSIEGMNHFNLDDVTGAIANIKAAKDLNIESKTLTKELDAKVADLLLPDAAQGVKDTIREELEEAAKKPPAPPPLLPGQVPAQQTSPGNPPGPEQKPLPTAA